HMSDPATGAEDSPATVSPKVLTGLLRGELEFKGIIATDALDMAGVTAKFHGGEASVRGLEAGADVLLMRPNPEQAIRAVVAAIESGRLTRRRVEESVLRVLAAKIHVGLTPGKKLVDLEAISDVLDPPEADERAQQ